MTANGYYALADLYREEARLLEQQASMPAEACPNDGQPLVRDRHGRLHCNFDGWTSATATLADNEQDI